MSFQWRRGCLHRGCQAFVFLGRDDCSEGPRSLVCREAPNKRRRLELQKGWVHLASLTSDLGIERGTEAVGEDVECLLKICELSARVYWFFSDDKEDLSLGRELSESLESLHCSIRTPCMCTEGAFLAIYRLCTGNTSPVE